MTLYSRHYNKDAHDNKRNQTEEHCHHAGSNNTS